MSEEIKPIGTDTEGYHSLKRAMLALLSEYPGLGEQDVVFENLPEKSSGLAVGADSGALIITRTENILGDIRQECQFPFFVIYRTSADSETQKLRVADFLDTFGMWLMGQPVTLSDVEYRLKTYPSLTGGRRITGVTVFNSYGIEPTQDGYQDWYLPATVNYTNEYEPW